MIESLSLNERLALAMSWQLFPYSYPVGGDQSKNLYCPPGERVHISTARECPRFDSDHNAKQDLLTWIAADDDRWQLFEDILRQVLRGDKPFPPIGRDFMTATPAQVAEAAGKMLESIEAYKALPKTVLYVKEPNAT